MGNLKSRLSDLLMLYLTMLSLFEAIVLEQLVSRTAVVSGGAYLDGWTIGLLLQALIVLGSVLFMWVGFMTITAPIRRVIRGSDFLMPFLLGSVQLLSIQVMELETQPAFLLIFLVGFLSGYFAVRINLDAARTDKVSALVVRLFQLKYFTLMTALSAGCAILGAISLSFSQTIGNIFAAIVLALIVLQIVGTLRWWTRFVTMNRINDPASNSPLKKRVTGLLSIYLTLVSLFEAVVLEQLISRLAVVSGGPFLEGWTLDLGLQGVVVFASIVTMWIAFLTDLIPIRRVMFASDLVNVIAIGLFQLVAIQLVEAEIQAIFLLVVGVGAIGAVITRHKNHKAALTDIEARGIVRLYPHLEMMVLLGLLFPVGVIGAVGQWFFAAGGQIATFGLILIFLAIDVMLMRWWTRVVNMNRLQ